MPERDRAAADAGPGDTELIGGTGGSPFRATGRDGHSMVGVGGRRVDLLDAIGLVVETP